MKKVGFSILFSFFTAFPFAYTQERCGLESQSLINHIDLYAPAFDASFENFYRTISHEYNRDQKILYIPVHVIIVHPPNQNIGDANNPNYEKIVSQIDAINKDFLRLNPDTINTPSIFTKGRPNIQFCLASIDPEGNETDGITRYPSIKNFDLEESKIKMATGWPRKDYLNLWVADISSLGFSYIPTNTTLPISSLDGVTIDHDYFGGPGSGASEPYDLGRTATHEIGHFLGLKHIWYTNGCNGDDGIADTPLQNTSNSGCKKHPFFSCGNNGDMFMNFMDYTDDVCMNAFSFDQALYMRSILQSIRFSLLNSGKSICGDSSVGIEEVNAIKDQFTLGPNPCKDNLVLTYNGYKNEEVSIGIYDIFGKLIWHEDQILLSAEKNIHTILANNIANSIFIFKIASKFRSTHFMIIKD